MTRIIPRLLIKGAIFGALLCPATLYALGLGDIHLNSALSQPFDAEIELLSPTVEELSSLKVGLANSEGFARFGLERPSFLSNFVFRVTPTGNGRAVVRVTSSKSITEPVISLVLEVVSAGGGRQQREYTVFLDPPVFVPSQPAQQAVGEPRATVPPATETARSEGVIERATVPPVDATPPPAEAAVVVPPPVATTPTSPTAEPAISEPMPTADHAVPAPVATLSGDSYEVQRNESLWKIASRLRPGAPQTINQTMIALYRANPSAFAGNINRLRAGAVLRIPQAEEFDAVDMRGATAEVTRQFNEWRPEAAAIADEAHLRLVTPTEPAVPIESAATSKSKAAEKAATEKAAAEKIASDKAKTQEAERVAAATKQREADAEAKRLLDLKNAELARMQADREKRAAAEAEATKAAPAEKVAEATPPSEVVVPTPEEPAQTKPKPAQVKPPVEVEPSFMDKVNENRTYVLGGLALLLLIGGGIVYSRRRQPVNRSLHFPMPSASEPTLTPADFDAAMDDAPAAGRGRAQTESYDFESASRGPESLPEAEGTKPLYTGAPPEFAPSKPTRSADDTMSSETAVHLDQQDAVAEADFHMAYGLYDQAADLVKIAIGREPKRRDLKLKLLEIYFVWGNKELFVESARELHDSRSQSPAGEWDKILIMGKQIAPEDALFKGGSVASPGDNLDVNLEGGENRVDFDLFSAPEAGESDQGGALDFEIGNTGARAKPSSHLDFLLDDSGSAALADDDTREMDSNARTQETPTIESPVLARMQESLREPTVEMHFGEQSTDQTAELSIDDLGLDVGSLESTGSLERTTALSGARREHLGDEIGDEEMTRIAPAALIPPKARPASLEPTMEVPQISLETSQRVKGNSEDSEDGDVGVSTIYLEQMEAGSGDVLDTLGPRGDETAHMLSPADLDLDLAQFGDTDASEDDTIRRKAARMQVPTEATAEMPALRKQRPSDTAATVEQPRPNRADMMVATSELPEIEPVTMSEVGTKLDLARAYMDMGDPDGARSILEEVLGEGNSGQRAEAQRLLDSIR